MTKLDEQRILDLKDELSYVDERITDLNKERKKLINEIKEIEAIEAKNALFAQASPTKKRVLIAQDVINSIRASQYTADTGIWCKLNTNKELSNQRGEQLQHLLQDTANTSCRVCALGACFTSAVKLGNDQLIDDHIVANHGANLSENDAPPSRNRIIKRYFTPDQSKLIELAYEQGNGWYKLENVRGKEVLAISKKAVAFGRKYQDDSGRMIAIMENIVKNNGTFKP